MNTAAIAKLHQYIKELEDSILDVGLKDVWEYQSIVKLCVFCDSEVEIFGHHEYCILDVIHKRRNETTPG